MHPALAQPAALTEKVPAPAVAAKGKALALLAAPGAADWKALRMELRAAQAGAEKRAGRLQPLPLTLRALAGLVLDRQGDEQGLRFFAEACGSLHRQLKLMQRVHGAEAKETIPYLDALLDLYQLEKLNGDRWEDASLRVALRHSRGPRPDLEARLVAAIERHYGPFLSFRPPDRPALLEDVARLLALWSRRHPAAERTRAFADVGLRSDARGVWKQVSSHAGESLREELKAFLAGLDPAVLFAEIRTFLAWLPGQAAAPWKSQARALAGAVDAAIQESAQPASIALRNRVRLARAMGEPERAAALIGDALEDGREDRAAVLALAQDQLQERPDPALARRVHEALLAGVADLAAEGSGRALLEADAQRQEADGEFESAETLWRSLLAAAPPDRSRAALELALGSNLAAQRRWEEARFFLEPLTTVDKWQAEPTLRFQLAGVERGRGDLDAARRWAREGLALLDGDGPVRPLAGLAASLRLLAGDPPGAGPAEAILERARLTLDPEGLVPALHDRATLLALLEGLEQARAKPPVVRAAGCGGPWTAVGEDPAGKGMALLQAAAGLRLEDAEPCLREALRYFETAFHGEDPRLLLPLLRLGRCLQDREDSGAEAIYRRILDLAAAHPEAEPLMVLEARARLGQLLSEQGRDEAADRLLQDALEGLLAVPSIDPKVLEMLGGVVLMRAARLEYREEYHAAAQVLEQVEARFAREPAGEVKLESELRELTRPITRLLRKAQLQTLLRAQGLP